MILTAIKNQVGHRLLFLVQYLSLLHQCLLETLSLPTMTAQTICTRHHLQGSPWTVHLHHRQVSPSNTIAFLQCRRCSRHHNQLERRQGSHWTFRDNLPRGVAQWTPIVQPVSMAR